MKIRRLGITELQHRYKKHAVKMKVRSRCNNAPTHACQCHSPKSHLALGSCKVLLGYY